MPRGDQKNPSFQMLLAEKTRKWTKESLDIKGTFLLLVMVFASCDREVKENLKSNPEK